MYFFAGRDLDGHVSGKGIVLFDVEQTAVHMPNGSRCSCGDGSRQLHDPAALMHLRRSADLSVPEVNRWMARMTADGYAPKSVAKPG